MHSPSPPLQQVDRTFVRHRGRKLSYFGGCDYFRLSSHPAVTRALRGGLEEFGLNTAASRMTTGNHTLYELLEEKLAGFFGVESAVLLSSGYLTNLAAAQALAGDFSHALADERAHASLVDAAKFLSCPVAAFKHRDAIALARALRRCGPRAKPLVLTDGVFAHDGEVAPLKDYLRALPANGALLVDDAHGAGTLGSSGRGTAEWLGIADRRIIQTVTFSKAFGVYGGAVLGTRGLKKKIWARGRAFVGNTPLPLPLVCAVLKSLETLRADNSLRHRLEANTRFVKDAVRRGGLPVPANPCPIVSLVPRNTGAASRLRKRLLTREVYPSFIRYPGGPDGGYFRFAISSEHTREQLHQLVAALSGT
jgi:7-keto-8-aminopelargonate synthetase-like enzyme